MTRHLTPALGRRKLEAAQVLLADLADEIEAALTALHACQPGYPSGGDGGGGKGAVSDRTGELAVKAPDRARADLDALTRLVERACSDLADAYRVAHSWQPPSPRWREVLAGEAAAELGNDGACRSHLRIGQCVETRRPGGTDCRWCEDMRRELGGLPPVWLLEKRERGARVSTIDIAKAKREVRAKGRGRR